MAFPYRFEFERGATFDKTLVYKTGPDKVVVDLTGCTAHAQFRAKTEKRELLLDLSTENGGIELGGVAGTIRFRVPAAATRRFGWKLAEYDVLLTYPDGTVKRFMAEDATCVHGATVND